MSLAPAGGSAAGAAAARPASSIPPKQPSELTEPSADYAAPLGAPIPSDRYGDFRLKARSGMDPPAAPSIRKMARELGIDLTRVRGSQAGGRIVLEDLRAYVQRLQQLAFQPGKAPPGPPQGPAARPAEAVDFSKWGAVRREKMSALRRTVSQRMSQAWAIPKINQFDDADITRLLALRKKYAAAYEKKQAHLTLTPFILAVVARALRKYPRVNTSIDEAAHEIVFKDYCHIGVAVDTEAGLIVPVLRDVDKKSLVDLFPLGVAATGKRPQECVGGQLLRVQFMVCHPKRQRIDSMAVFVVDLTVSGLLRSNRGQQKGRMFDSALEAH